MSDCDNKDCAARKIREIVQSLNDRGADLDDVMTIVMLVIGEVYGVDIGGIELREVAGGEVVH